MSETTRDVEGPWTMQTGTAGTAGERVAMLLATYDWCVAEWQDRGLHIIYGHGDAPSAAEISRLRSENGSLKECLVEVITKNHRQVEMLERRDAALREVRYQADNAPTETPVLRDIITECDKVIDYTAGQRPIVRNPIDLATGGDDD